jgi:hypothetical protein
MNVSVKGSGNVAKHWLDHLNDLLHSGLVNQTEIRLIRDVLKAFEFRTVSGSTPRVKGVLDISHAIGLRNMSKRINHDTYSPVADTAANEVEEKIK